MIPATHGPYLVLQPPSASQATRRSPDTIGEDRSVAKALVRATQPEDERDHRTMMS